MKLNSRAKQQVVPLGYLPVVLQNIQHQREIDRRWRNFSVLYPKEEEKLKLPPAEHKARYLRAGFDLDIEGLPADQLLTQAQVLNRRYTLTAVAGGGTFVPMDFATPPPKCEKCGVSLTMSDPPECACGAHFCSVACHKAEWSSHKKLCDMVEDNNGLALLLTSYYWQMQELVISPTGRDMQAEWFETYQKSYEAAGKDELDFYLEVEKNELRDLMSESQQIAKRAGMDSSIVLKELFRQFQYAATPLDVDTFHRLWFKIMMLQVSYTLFGQMGIDIDTYGIEDMKTVLSRFVPLLQMTAPTYLKKEDLRMANNPSFLMSMEARERLRAPQKVLGVTLQ